MAVVTPTFVDNVSIVSAQVLARGSTVRGTVDLRTVFGAYVFLKIGRGGTTVLSSGVMARIRRVINNDTATAGGVHPLGITFRGGLTAAAGTTCATSDSNSGQATVTVASVAGFTPGDLVCIQDSGGGVTRLEWQLIAKISGAVLTVDRNLQFTHTAAGADTVRNQCDVYAPVWVPGGSLIEVIFDYAQQTTGESVTVSCLGQTYASESVV